MRTIVTYTHSERSAIAIQMMKDAIDLTKNATRIRTESGEHENIDHLVCNIGSTEHNSSIYLANQIGAQVAYYCNGQFWLSWNKTAVTLQ
jgi:hypothetical protein